MNKNRTFFISLIFLVTITACVLPGLSSTPPTPIFAPTVDTGLIETRVAGTVSAAIAQTEQSTANRHSNIPSDSNTHAHTSIDRDAHSPG